MSEKRDRNPRGSVGGFLRRVVAESSPGNSDQKPAVSPGNSEQKSAVSPGNSDPKNVLIVVKAGDRIVYSGTAWALVTTELFEMNAAVVRRDPPTSTPSGFIFSGPYKVFANGIEQEEPFIEEEI